MQQARRVACPADEEWRTRRPRDHSMQATPTSKATVAKKNELPHSSCHPCSLNSTFPPLGTHQIGAHQNNTAPSPAHSRPPAGRSGPKNNQSSTGTAHTM